MKTNLPLAITTVEQAKKFLYELHKNGESYYPEDDANNIDWSTCDPTKEECEQLNKLMDNIYELEGNDGRHVGPMIFDPCDYLLELDGNLNNEGEHIEVTYGDNDEPEEDEEDDLPTFSFHIDRKVTTWERCIYDVPAKSIEEAREKMKAEMEAQECDEKETGFMQCETLYNCNEYPTVEENDGEPTTILYEDDAEIANNATVATKSIKDETEQIEAIEREIRGEDEIPFEKLEVAAAIKKAGYNEQHTGGGCMSYVKELRNGAEAIFSCECELPTSYNDTISLVINDGESNPIHEPVSITVRELLKIESIITKSLS